jgi:hypothetical protein
VLTEAEIVFRSKGDILIISFFDQIEKVNREMAISPVELFEKFWIFKEVEEEDVVAVIAGVDRETGEDVEFEVKKGMACASVSVSEALGTLAVVCGKVISVSDGVVRMETAAGSDVAECDVDLNSVVFDNINRVIKDVDYMVTLPSVVSNNQSSYVGMTSPLFSPTTTEDQAHFTIFYGVEMVDGKVQIHRNVCQTTKQLRVDRVYPGAN